MKIDDIDIKILSELQRDSRLSIRELSRKINLSPPSVAERVRRLEEKGIIEEYTIKINKQKIGFPIECIIKVTMKNGEHERFKNFITNHKRSDFCFRVAGDACFIVKMSVSTLDEIEEFINEVSHYTTTSTTIVLSEVHLADNIIKFFSE